jgi:hypothetical protein
VKRCKVGDLVHIPQAVELIDFEASTSDDAQLTIPLRVMRTQEPKVGVITKVQKNDGYIQVYCEGAHWATLPGSIYRVGENKND